MQYEKGVWEYLVEHLKSEICYYYILRIPLRSKICFQ